MSVTSVWGNLTGFGGAGQPNPDMTDSGAYSTMYTNALAGINGAGASPGMQSLTDNVQSAAGGAAGNLTNGMAGLKSNYLQDMGQNFSANTQANVRAQGGTGGLANATLGAGKANDNEGQTASQGLNSLYQTGVQDIGALSGVQNQQFGQELNQANSAAGVDMNQEKLQLGIDQQNNANLFQAQQEQGAKQNSTISGLASFGSSMFAKGGEVKNFHDYARSKLKGFSAGGEADVDSGIALDGPGWANQKRFVPALNPSQKAVKQGNSPKNDKVPAMLSEGEVILPRTVSQAPDAPLKAAHFMEDVRAKDGPASSDFHSFAKKALQHFDDGGEEGGGGDSEDNGGPSAPAASDAPGGSSGGPSPGQSGSGGSSVGSQALKMLGAVAQNAANIDESAMASRRFAKGGKIRKRSA